MPIKVVIIGGGSSYTPELIEGMLDRYESFPITNIVLVDIKEGEEKLETVGKLAKRMIKKAGKQIHLTWTLDRREALKDADFVTTQIRVGGLKAREKDERIPLSHGFIGQETNGAGGIMKAFRTIPILMDIANDIHDICPNAWLINFTNPAGIIIEALIKYSHHKRVIGVCNIPLNMRHSVAEILAVKPSDIMIEFIGMNHFVFGSKIYVKGMERTEEVLAKLQEKLDYSPANIVSLGWTKELLQSLKVLPNPYHDYYFHTREVLNQDVKAFREYGTRAEIVQQLEKDLFMLYSDSKLNAKPKELEERGGAYYSDVACSLMDSLYNNKRDVQTVNTINNGAISDLPEDTVIEANCIITKDGPEPILVGNLPISIKGIILQMKNTEELVIQAALSGKYEDAYLSFLMNPLIGDEKMSKTLLNELLIAHKEHLPQFKEAIRQIEII